MSAVELWGYSIPSSFAILAAVLFIELNLRFAFSPSRKIRRSLENDWKHLFSLKKEAELINTPDNFAKYSVKRRAILKIEKDLEERGKV